MADFIPNKVGDGYQALSILQNLAIKQGFFPPDESMSSDMTIAVIVGNMLAYEEQFPAQRTKKKEPK